MSMLAVGDHVSYENDRWTITEEVHLKGQLLGYVIVNQEGAERSVSKSMVTKVAAPVRRVKTPTEKTGKTPWIPEWSKVQWLWWWLAAAFLIALVVF